MRERALQPGHILTGTLFSEPMRVETVRAHGAGVWEVGLVGVQSERFRKVTLTSRDLDALVVQESLATYAGDGRLLRLGLQAYMLGIAHEFDPYFGLSISRVDPLPHQLEAVYDYLLKLARVRFLLANDAGAGKTIMAGLLIRELKLRGLVERLLVVCPANLAFQWQRELKEKFDETFLVLKGSDIRDQFGVNQWLEHKHVITSLDLAKRDEILPGLHQVHWDLAIVDEAHRMSWTPPARKTARYALGELIRDTTDHLLLLTATPHKGDPTNFACFCNSWTAMPMPMCARCVWLWIMGTRRSICGAPRRLWSTSRSVSRMAPGSLARFLRSVFHIPLHFRLTEQNLPCIRRSPAS
jgi:SNF2-related domain